MKSVYVATVASSIGERRGSTIKEEGSTKKDEGSIDEEDCSSDEVDSSNDEEKKTAKSPGRNLHSPGSNIRHRGESRFCCQGRNPGCRGSLGTAEVVPQKSRVALTIWLVALEMVDSMMVGCMYLK